MSEKKSPAGHRNETRLARLEQDQTESREIEAAELRHRASGYTEERDVANELMGRIQMAGAMSKLAIIASLADLARIKENKLYRALAGKTVVAPDGEEIGNAATWDGFCRSLGLVKRTVDDQLLNRRELGAEAYDALVRVGIGPRSINRLRHLPSEDRTAIVQEVEVNLDDKDEIIGLIDDLAAKHTKEKEALEKELNEVKATSDAKDEVLADKSKKIDELATRLNREPTPDERQQEDSKWTEAQLKALGGAATECTAAIAALGGVISGINNRETSIPVSLMDAIPNQVSMVAQRLREMATANEVWVDVGEIIAPAWEREAHAAEPGEPES